MTLKIAGCDLGKASAGFVVVRVDDHGAILVESATRLAHEGDPFGLFKEWYRKNGIAGCAALAATGLCRRVGRARTDPAGGCLPGSGA